MTGTPIPQSGQVEGGDSSFENVYIYGNLYYDFGSKDITFNSISVTGDTTLGDLTVNDFTVEEELSPSIFRVQPYVVQAQDESLRSVRDVRDSDAVSSALTRLRDVAQGDGDLMNPIMDSIRAYATIGEICGVMKDVFGDYEASTAL